MAGKENGDRDRDVDGERDEHPHPVAMQNPSARARVETRLHVNVEKPIRAAEQRLASATDAAVDAGHPKQYVVVIVRDATIEPVPCLITISPSFCNSR